MAGHLLARLLQHFYIYEDSFVWGLKEDIPLNHLDPKLNKELLEWVKTEKATILLNH